MAKKSGGATSKANYMDKAANTKLGEIYTAAKSTMEPRGYETGYPANENELTNARPSIIRGKNKAH